jgi:hypothetical protein
MCRLVARFPGTRIPLVQDECRWFNEAFASGLFEFQDCQHTCPRLKRWLEPGRDEFLNPAGQARHLYSFPCHRPRLNREYVPHIAAHARAILEFGYDRKGAVFSERRYFARDLIVKKRGGRYELDSLFKSGDQGSYLHVEVKSKPREVAAMATAIDRFRELGEMPLDVVKEVEYVLDLEPKYFWLVGPGTLDPEAHVWRIEVDGKRARFERILKLPSPH